jgi:spermidine/putrescine-binding protein
MIYPSEGTNIWVDALVLNRNISTQHEKNAYTFFEFLQEEAAQDKMKKELFYTVPYLKYNNSDTNWYKTGSRKEESNEDNFSNSGLYYDTEGTPFLFQYASRFNI